MASWRKCTKSTRMPQGLVHFCTIRGPRLHQSWSVSAPIGGLLSHQRRGLAEHESQASRHAVAPEEIWCAAPSARGSYGAADRNRPAKAQDQTAARCHAAWVETTSSTPSGLRLRSHRLAHCAGSSLAPWCRSFFGSISAVADRTSAAQPPGLARRRLTAIAVVAERRARGQAGVNAQQRADAERWQGLPSPRSDQQAPSHPGSGCAWHGPSASPARRR